MTGAGLAAVIGWPAGQSLSPVIHKHWLKQHRIAGDFVALPVRPEDFGGVIAALPRMGFRGASITMPHKEAAFSLSTVLDEGARATGAVNLLVFDNGAVQGGNTDIIGFKQSARAAFGAEAMRKGAAVVIGAGGAARAVVFALAQGGAPEIRIVNRTRSRAEALATIAPVKVFAPGDGQAFAGATLVVNASSHGMGSGHGPEVPFARLSKEAMVADVVYRPLETALLKGARAQGDRTMDGLGMLMHQAVPAFAAWFGVTPAVTPELRARLEDELRG
jgi:shikimate dehydrogenase